MKVPLVDLKAQYISIKEEVDRAIAETLREQRFILGPAVASLEEEVADYCHVRYAVGVASGTDALILSLMALGIGEGDEVITTPFTFIATASAIRRVGARPVFVDIDPLTFNIDVGRIEDKVSGRTKAVIPVHLFGQTADMKEVLDLAARHGLHIIEDAAQAIGAQYGPRRAGSMGDLGCLSFFPSKNLGGYGDGGMVLTGDEGLAGNIKRLRHHGCLVINGREVLGFNSRLDELQAAILRVKLKYLEEWIEARRKNASAYREHLSGLEFVTLPQERAGNRHTYHQFVIRARDRDRLKEYLDRNDIGTAVYYPLPLHLAPGFADLGYRPGDLPEAEAASKEVLALPIYPELTSGQIELVAGVIRKFYRAGAPSASYLGSTNLLS